MGKNLLRFGQCFGVTEGKNWCVYLVRGGNKVGVGVGWRRVVLVWKAPEDTPSSIKESFNAFGKIYKHPYPSHPRVSLTLLQAATLSQPPHSNAHLSTLAQSGQRHATRFRVLLLSVCLCFESLVDQNRLAFICNICFLPV